MPITGNLSPLEGIGLRIACGDAAENRGPARATAPQQARARMNRRRLSLFSSS
jgi:hypothetical protein